MTGSRWLAGSSIEGWEPAARAADTHVERPYRPRWAQSPQMCEGRMTSTGYQSESRLSGAEAPEWARLEDLSRTRLLDTPSEERFDRITRLAQGLFGVSAASISLIAEDRQFLKSFVGPLARESERRDTFCTEAIKSPGTMIVENALTDERFRQSPLVTGNPHIQFYAGHPLTGPGGTHVGTFCIIDQAPRVFSAEQQKILEDLTEIIQREIKPFIDMTTEPG